MPLKPLPDQGIEVPLSEYNRLRAFQGGGWFWDHDNQQIIREALGDFLPRVEERRDKSGALFQQFVHGVEIASRSQAIGAQMNRVPKSEHHRLQRALENLKLRAQNPNTDPNARRVIEKFCLPDPAKDPDLYRLYGSRWNRKLLVLWGCEREEGSSLAPASALNKMPVEAATASFVRRLPLWIGLLLLLLLLFLGLREVWHRNQSANGERSLLATSDPALPQPAAPNGGTPPPANEGNTRNPSSNQDNLIRPPNSDPGSAAGALAFNATPAPDSTPSAAYLAGNNAASPVSGSPAAPSVSPARAHTTGAASPRPAASSSPASETTTTTNRKTDTLTSTNRQTSRAGASPTPAGINSPQAAEETSNADAASTPTAGNVPAAMPPADEEEAQPTQAATPSTPPTVEILKAQASSAPHDGKMDMVLMVAAHEADNSLTPFQVTVWNVDGVPQRDRTGGNVTSGQLALTLPSGKHRVGVAGTARGIAVQFETEVNVQIKSQGDITIKPRGAK